uniref:phosphoenolpyruvate carboxykinase (GTP) n=1 Tax=Platynereis dumerilii TaxID=6359 RepID=A0A6B9MKM8_PLADU|nr:phosphoenolpyruvate carboxykinase-like [Platynereis dumerilii]
MGTLIEDGPFNLAVVPEKHCLAARLRHDSFVGELDISQVTTIDDIDVPVVKGDFNALPLKVRQFVAKTVNKCTPRGIWICDGSPLEVQEIREKMESRGQFHRLNQQKWPNCYVCRTDPLDVARVEGKTYVVTDNRYESVPHVKEGVKGILGNWMSPEQMKQEMTGRLPGCMKGRTLYVIPFSMGPVGSPLSKIGIELTDSNYVVLSMFVMTRVSPKIWNILGDKDFVRCVHTLGAPRPVENIISHWPCNPERIIIAQYPEDRMIISFGSGYGGNSLLGKKCFALRIASSIARDEGWLAEHMLIMSVTNPAGEEKFIAAAFPSACGKTNMAMLESSLPGWKVKCVGDDIAWMRFDKHGRLRAINPEAGFFGVAPGTNRKTNPIAMETLKSNTIFTNVAMTEDGDVFWEGLEKYVDMSKKFIDWKGRDWKIGQEGKAAHPNSRFCSPASQCPIIHNRWEDPEGVPIDAIIFGGRRPEGVPLVYESFSWEHGVMVGAALKSETTAAAEFKGKQIMHDPMAMRPFMGYNFGDYLQHWLNINKPDRHMPKIFHVNWFRLDEQGNFMWPGFGDNIRVIDWICRRCNGEEIAQLSPIGLLPTPGSINTDGLDKLDMEGLFDLPKDYWVEDIRETRQFLDDQVGEDLPTTIQKELQQQQERISAM